MTRLRPLALILIPIVVILCASAAWLGRDPVYEAKCDNYVEKWPRHDARPYDTRPMIVVAGSSVSGMRVHRETLAHSLEKRLQSIDARVYNGTGSGTFLADQWALVEKTAGHDVALYLFEINALLFNERIDLLAPGDNTQTVRETSNAATLFLLDEWRLRWHLWRQDGFETMLQAALGSVLRPYESGQCMQKSRRSTLRKVVLGRANRIKALTPMHLRRGVAGRNFRNKDYKSGIDLWVLERFSEWALENDVPVLFYFPPLNVPYIEKAAGDEAWARFETWKGGFLTSCRERGLACDDYTRLFAHDTDIFMDYAHYPQGAKRQRGFDELADHIARTAQRELARRAAR